MTPLLIKHGDLKNPALDLASKIFSLGVDVALPLSLLVVGILGKSSVLHISPAASFGMIGAGSLLSLVSIGSWGRFFYQRRQNTSSSPVMSSNSLTSAWEDRIFCYNADKQAKILEKMKDKPSSASPYGCIIFFHAHGQATVFFTTDGTFSSESQKIRQTTGQSIIFICPSDQAIYEQWAKPGHLTRTSDEQLVEFITNRKPDVHVLTVRENAFFNAWLNGQDVTLPEPLKKALGFK